ncbi:MAG: porin family protein [bacterium]|nr:porin family protein [bacterium]
MRTILTHIYLRMAALAVAALAGLILWAPGAHAERLNDKVLNRPYSDNRRWHLGFSVGLNTMDFSFHHNGFVTEQGQTWFMEQPSFSPGFCVNGLFSVRLNNYFSVRVTPGMYFGNRVVRFLDTTGGQEEKQDIKSAYLVLPVDLKFSSQRMHNIRPYMVAGVMPAFDVMKKKTDFLRTNSTDFMLSVGFGCDLYLPYFKLIPELKFCFGLSDALNHDRPDLVDDPLRAGVSSSVKKATTKMVVLSFYFE